MEWEDEEETKRLTQDDQRRGEPPVTTSGVEERQPGEAKYGSDGESDFGRTAPPRRRWNMSLRRTERDGAAVTGSLARSVTQDEAQRATGRNSESPNPPTSRGEQLPGARGEEAGGGMVRRHRIFHHSQSCWDRVAEELRSRGRAMTLSEEEAFQRLATTTGDTAVDPEDFIGTVNEEWDGWPIGVVPWSVRAALVRAGWFFIRVAHATLSREPVRPSPWLAGMASVALGIRLINRRDWNLPAVWCRVRGALVIIGRIEASSSHSGSITLSEEEVLNFSIVDRERWRGAPTGVVTPEVGYMVVTGERLAHAELVASRVTTFLQALVEERGWEGFGVAEVRRFRADRGQPMEELVHVKTVSQLLADRLRAYFSANDVFIPTSASMDQAGEVRLTLSIHVGDILREPRTLADGADKEAWGRRLRVPFELRERWPNTKKVMDQITELATLNGLRITSFRLLPTWPRQFVIVTMSSEAAARRLANIILQEGNRLDFVAEYVTVAEEARKAAREAGAGAGMSNTGNSSGAAYRPKSAPTTTFPGRGNWQRGAPDAGTDRRGGGRPEGASHAGTGGRGGVGRPHRMQSWTGGTGDNERRPPVAESWPWRGRGGGGAEELKSGGTPDPDEPVRSMHRAAMDELTDSFGRSLAKLSTAVETRMGHLEARLEEHEQRIGKGESKIGEVERTLSVLGEGLAASLQDIMLRSAETRAEMDHMQDLLSSLMQEPGGSEYLETGRKRPHTTGDNGGKEA